MGRPSIYLGHMLRYLLPPTLIALAGAALGQCGPCAIGDTCTVDPPFPTVCPAITPPGTVGVPYVVDVTFWIPPAFAEPTSSLNVVLDEVVLNSLENVPLGLTYEANSPNLTYYPQQEPFGCVRVCGIPMEAGNDTIIIHATVQGTVGGVNTTQGYDLFLPVMAHPADQDTAPDFTTSPGFGCEPLTVSFDPLINAPGLSSAFVWDFGNGNVHTGPAPPDQTYAAGEYEVTLQTTVSGIFLTQLSISEVNENWCGDVDEPDLPFVGCVGQPDLYFTVTDAQLGLSRSSVASNTQSHSWTGLSIPLGFPPFTLRLYDEDGLSEDDLLGTYTFDNASGTFPFSQGGTSGQRVVASQTVETFEYADTVSVFPAPNTTLGFNMTTGTLCVADFSLSGFVWTLDGDVVGGETGPCVAAYNGLWTVTATNAQGCSSTSSYEVIGLGVPGTTIRPGVDLFPVPSTGEFTVRSAGWSGTLLDILVLDATGRCVHQERSSAVRGGSTRTIDLGDVPAGAYALRMSDGSSIVEKRFTVVPR